MSRLPWRPASWHEDAVRPPVPIPCPAILTEAEGIRTTSSRPIDDTTCVSQHDGIFVPDHSSECRISVQEAAGAGQAIISMHHEPDGHVVMPRKQRSPGRGAGATR